VQCVLVNLPLQHQHYGNGSLALGTNMFLAGVLMLTSRTCALFAGVYNEQVFRGLDYCIAQFARHGIKVIVALNNYWENSDSVGNVKLIMMPSSYVWPFGAALLHGCRQYHLLSPTGMLRLWPADCPACCSNESVKASQVPLQL
jgi:hypothetical protein